VEYSASGNGNPLTDSTCQIQYKGTDNCMHTPYKDSI
jgi:hypothetical protein